MAGRLTPIFIALAVASLVHAEPPITFDLREVDGTNYVTSVKSQSGGTCWTHGAMAAIEGNLLITGNWAGSGETGEPNLAEYHLDWWNGFNRYNNDDVIPPIYDGLIVHNGGDYLVTAAYLSRGEGAVRDIDGQSFLNPPARHNPGYHHFYVRDIEWYTVGTDLSNINLIKEKLMSDGAIGTAMLAYSFMSGYIHYQPPDNPADPTHAVAIVGWDDTLTTQAPLPGAWLCKNSWGTMWAFSGYFWISYYDKHCGQHPEMGAVSFQNVEPSLYDHVYYHDYHGWRDTKDSVVSAFNAFVAVDRHVLRGVSFFTSVDSVTCDVRIYSSFDGGVLDGEMSQAQGEYEYRGLHTLDLETPVELNPGDRFYICADLSDGGHAFDRTSEVPILLGAKAPTLVASKAAPDQSFYFDGSYWVDLYDEGDHTHNFCIKGLASSYISILLPDALPRYLLPGEPTTISVRMRELADTCLPGEFLLHYRSDNGGFLTLPLVPSGGDLYEVTLPGAGCGVTFEYYFSAEGSTVGEVTNPSDAPDHLYSVSVGGTNSYIVDDFNTDHGWSVENSDNLTSGGWERVWPLTGGARGTPPTDFDDSRYCFVTGALGDDNDVDSGSTVLISPLIDLSGGYAEISYARWYYNAPGDDDMMALSDSAYDVMKVSISNDNGASWRTLETVKPKSPPEAQWIQRSFPVSYYVTPSEQVRVRFVVTDFGTPSIIEAGIDDFRVSMFKCQPEGCCGADPNGQTGNANCSPDGKVTLNDILTLLDHLYLSHTPLCCEANGNANGSLDGKVSLADVIHLIDHLYISKQPTEPCQ